MAKTANLKAIAFADHNTVGSLDEGFELSRQYDIELIPCFELNTLYQNMDLHILGFFVDYKNPDFLNWLIKIRKAKKRQAAKRLEALQALGFAIDQEDVDRVAEGKTPTGSTFLDALLSRDEGKRDLRLRPYIDGEKSNSPALNFYRDYFRMNKPAFVALDACPTEEGIRKIKQFGGVPVQAHPSDTGDDIIIEMIEMGLMGLEAYSSYHTTKESKHFCALADKYDILITAGSDFHGMKIKPNVEFADVGGNKYDIVERLKDARGKN